MKSSVLNKFLKGADKSVKPPVPKKPTLKNTGKRRS